VFGAAKYEKGLNPVRKLLSLRVFVFALLIAATALVWGWWMSRAERVPTRAERPAQSGQPQQLSSQGQATLRGIVQAANLPDLRWPNFSDYEKHVEKLYESYGYSLPWIKGMTPTTQAQQAIAVLQNAEQKGLSSEDYDGPRWNDRVAKLKPMATPPSEADTVRFDVALTICLMRYI
jgi:L,D-transpeptidase YcbB